MSNDSHQVPAFDPQSISPLPVRQEGQRKLFQEELARLGAQKMQLAERMTWLEDACEAIDGYSEEMHKLQLEDQGEFFRLVGQFSLKESEKPVLPASAPAASVPEASEAEILAIFGRDSMVKTEIINRQLLGKSSAKALVSLVASGRLIKAGTGRGGFYRMA